MATRHLGPALLASSLIICFAGRPLRLQAATLVQFTVGNIGGSSVIGQSVTTPAGGPFNNIAFNFYGFDGSLFPTAAGTLFILDQPFLGAPADLGSAPGLIGQSTGISGGIYQFDPSLTLLGSTQYFFYANQGFPTRGDPFDHYAEGKLYAVNGTGNFAPTFADADFLLTGSIAPLPSALFLGSILLPATLASLTLHRRRHATPTSHS